MVCTNVNASPERRLRRPQRLALRAQGLPENTIIRDDGAFARLALTCIKSGGVS